ncbi:MAG: TIGR02281 family clan AA aspartic protease [Alphaproteobacteria bacterium]|nr:TIGR02281 family clan AA aspartic protease [Alphaproteobacteria bacterium]
MNGDQMMGILVGCLLLAFYLPYAVRRYRGASQKAGGHVAIWLGLLVLLVGGYAYQPELLSVKDRILGVLMPGRAMSRSDGVVVINKAADEAHFQLDAAVNGQSTSFVVDTGASSVVLTHETALRLGLLTGEDSYTQTVSTANGTTKVAPIGIGEMRIASISLSDVKASVARPGELDTNLLGMSFLSRLKGYAVEGNQLTLRQ